MRIDHPSNLPQTITTNPLEIAPKKPPSVDQGQMPSHSPWAQMFPQGASQEELKLFISTFIKQIMDECKHNDQKWKEAMRRQKEGLERG